MFLPRPKSSSLLVLVILSTLPAKPSHDFTSTLHSLRPPGLSSTLLGCVVSSLHGPGQPLVMFCRGLEQLSQIFTISPNSDPSSFAPPLWKDHLGFNWEVPLEPQNPPSFLPASLDYICITTQPGIIGPFSHLQKMSCLLQEWPSTCVLYTIPLVSLEFCIPHSLSILGLQSQLLTLLIHLMSVLKTLSL